MRSNLFLRLLKIVIISASIFLLSNCNHNFGVVANKNWLNDTIVPKDIKIDSGYKIRYIYNKNHHIDFNKDGLNDFVFVSGKEKMKAGDTSYIVFYKRNKDSTFTFVKQFGNIFPIYFDIKYGEKPKFDNPILKSLFYDCYMGMEKPFSVFEIKNDSIYFTKRLRAKETDKMRYLYRYDQQKNDWMLISKSRITKDGYYPIEIRDLKLLSNFSYCDD
jgi:hypothetical protein